MQAGLFKNCQKIFKSDTKKIKNNKELKLYSQKTRILGIQLFLTKNGNKKRTYLTVSAFLLYRELSSYKVKTLIILPCKIFEKHSFSKCTWLKKSDTAPRFCQGRYSEAAFLVSDREGAQPLRVLIA